MRPSRIMPLSVLLSLGAVSSAQAEAMICKNPGREYYLVYNHGDKAAIINPDSDNGAWNVLSTIFDDSHHVVIMSLGSPGMTAQVHFKPYRKVEIFNQGELVQTDACKS